MAGPRFLFALWAGKLLQKMSRLVGRGGGTAMPGLVATKLDPGFLTTIVSGLAEGSIAVTGTNGKTTTTRMISDILRAAGHNPITNRQGSNLVRGIASTALARASLSGKLSEDIGLWEADEAAFSPISDAVKPGLVVVNNLFRDQLDRYGEVERLRISIKNAIAKLPQYPDGRGTILVLNADDPMVASLGHDFQGKVLYFGLGDESWRLKGKVHAIDVRTCRLCGGELKYRINFLGHMGDWTCAKCGFSRPELDIRAENIIHKGMTAMEAEVSTPADAFHMTLNLSGIYNVYNVLAATAAAVALGIDISTVQKSIAEFRPAFGRFENLEVDKRNVFLMLIKNPTGANAVLETLLAANKEPFKIMIAINDLTADGRDVSWLWDADFELLSGHVEHAWTSGIRAADMALRLKYAGLGRKMITAGDDIEKTLFDALKLVPEQGTLYVLPTYTAMLAVQAAMAKRGYKMEYWKE